MKKYFLVFTLLLLQCEVFSQKYQERIDSLKAVMTANLDDSLKVNLYVEMLTVYDYFNPEEGLAIQNKALELAESTGSRISIARIKDRIGRLYWRTGKFKQAYKYHFDALDTYADVGDTKAQVNTLIWIGQDFINDNIYDKAGEYLSRALKLAAETQNKVAMARAYNILTALYEVQGNTVEASKAIYAGLKINEELGDKKGMAYATASLASNFQTLGNIEEALKHYRKSLQLSREAGDKLAETYVYRELGDLYCNLGNYEQAEASYREGFKVADQMENKWIVLSVLQRGIGNVYRAAGNYDQALHYLQLAADDLKSIAANQPLATLYSEIGMVYTQLKKYHLARKAFNDAMALCENLDTPVPMGNYFNGLQLLDSSMGNWKDAYTHYKQYTAIKDSSFNKETLRKLVGTQFQYENEKKEAIAKAEQDKKDLKTREDIRRQRTIKNSVIGALAIVMLFSVVFYLQRNRISREKKRSDQLVTDKELLLREIHHRVKNNLEVVSSLLALQSAHIDDPGTREAMQEGQNRVHSIGIVHQKLYQGENLGAIEMKDYFLNLSESILDSFGADSRISVELVMEKISVDIDTAVPLGLIVNELLTNALKYAFPQQQQGNVIIKLEQRAGGLLHLEVSDNGVGKSGATRGTGFGGQLVSLLTRQLNGTVSEEIKNGTKVFFNFKMDKLA
jgi:two-component sensor histidine kinase/tetratricopeptide (TPR) repeat protein